MNRVQNVEQQMGEYSPSIVVLGSCFLDYIAYVARAPQIGETMQSESFQKGFGGKGANQAVAAGRLGAKVAMVSMVGADGDGKDYIENFRRNGVDVTFMTQEKDSASGLAMIFVDVKTSNNEIVICPNATKHFTPDVVRRRTDNYNKVFTKHVKYLVCQNEIPLATTLDALQEAHRRGIYTIFNTAPAPTAEEVELIKPLLPVVSLFCPNEIEAAMITGEKITDTASAFRAVKTLQALGVQDVVITLGAAGYVIGKKGSEPVHQEGKRVKAVDTTGAGDCFVGSMTFFMNHGHSLEEACKRANECAAISVTRKGTQSSYPSPSDLPPGVLQN